MKSAHLFSCRTGLGWGKMHAAESASVYATLCGRQITTRFSFAFSGGHEEACRSCAGLARLRETQ